MYEAYETDPPTTGPGAEAGAEAGPASGAQARWEALQERMWDLEEQLRRCRVDEQVRLRDQLRDQWRLVVMELSELEDRWGPMSQRRPRRRPEAPQERDAA